MVSEEFSLRPRWARLRNSLITASVREPIRGCRGAVSALVCGRGAELIDAMTQS
jgi:hypothetical protein